MVHLYLKRRWSKKRIFVVIIWIAVAYGTWFNYLDSAKYCYLNITNNIRCADIGEILGNNRIYQPWNIIGHCLPGIFLLLMMPKRWELFIAGLLLSTAVMDSPLWGVMRLYAHGLPLWHTVNENFEDTTKIIDWIVFYYNPVGSHKVWKDSWPVEGQPTAALIFWSLVARVVIAILLVTWQERQEMKKRTSHGRDKMPVF
jgi:hypothetical protein